MKKATVKKPGYGKSTWNVLGGKGQDERKPEAKVKPAKPPKNVKTVRKAKVTAKGVKQ